jgi:hypothetical protein
LASRWRNQRPRWSSFRTNGDGGGCWTASQGADGADRALVPGGGAALPTRHEGPRQGHRRRARPARPSRRHPHGNDNNDNTADRSGTQWHDGGASAPPRRSRTLELRELVGTAGFEPATPCSQSQIERDCHLQRQRTAQVKTGMALSVVVRWRPVRAFVNGTLVARPARTTFTAWQ